MSTHRKAAKAIALWTLQGLLAALFLFAGATKLVMSADQLAASGLSVGFLRFIGVCEVFGALGLVLPGLFRVRRELTAFAAVGLVIIMAGAVVVTVRSHGVAAAGLPLVTGVLTAVIALGRRGPSLRTA